MSKPSYLSFEVPMWFLKHSSLLLGLLSMQLVYAHGPEPMPLQDVPVPAVPGLLDGASPIVINKEKAIALGKALFWDTNVGSDGMACGSCHHHAGTDRRVKNQLNPGSKSTLATANSFQALPSGGIGGPNYTLLKEDFPTYRFADPLSKTGGPIFSTDDAVASSGTFSGDFVGVSKFTDPNDACARSVDPVFHVDATGTRRVEPRNTPTMINAVFNYRNFWDGRANNVFNGTNNWGDRDPNAGVWVKTGPRTVAKERLRLVNSSLASLAVGPPLNDAEMACRQRSWPMIGRKLLLRQPLQNQKVHHQDSVLGIYSNSSPTELKNGLSTTYQVLVTQAFNSKYWSFNGTGAFGAPAGGAPYNQMEANFSLFFGIALQLYQSTLISDQAPIDLTHRAGVNMEPTWEFPPETGIVKSAEEKARLANGLAVFVGAHCNICHAGPVLTTSALDTNSQLVTATPGKAYGPSYFRIPYGRSAMAGGNGAEASGIWWSKNVVNRDDTTNFRQLMDLGFANTGVNKPDSDIGLGGVDDFGNPLSFSAQYVSYLLGTPTEMAKIKDTDVLTNVRSCDFYKPLARVSVTETNDTFKVSGDVELDGNREGATIVSQRRANCLNPPVSPAINRNNYIPTKAAALANLNGSKMARAIKGAFKIPSLRNVELTGPYMHNGSMATLEQVIEFYTRHGNVGLSEGNTQFHAMVNAPLLTDPDPSVEEQKIKDRADLALFLKTFTDERVRYEKAPFDHPEVVVPHGHAGDQTVVTGGNPINPNFGLDESLVIPAVGAAGADQPLLPFDAYLPSQVH